VLLVNKKLKKNCDGEIGRGREEKEKGRKIIGEAVEPKLNLSKSPKYHMTPGNL